MEISFSRRTVVLSVSEQALLVKLKLEEAMGGSPWSFIIISVF
jgi:hypothetical protein